MNDCLFSLLRDGMFKQRNVDGNNLVLVDKKFPVSASV